MPVSINDPFVQGAALPLLTSLLATGGLRLVSSRTACPSLASLAIGLGLTVVVLLVQGLIFPPVASTHKLPYLMLAGLAVGVILDSTSGGRRPLDQAAGVVVAVVWPLLVLLWLNSNRLDRMEGDDWLAYIGFAAGAMAFLLGLNRLRSDGWAALMATLFGAFGLGAIAMIGSSAMLAMLAFALAAACGGFALWNWPRQRDPYGVAALAGGAGAGITLAAQSFLFTDASGWGLLLLLGLLANRPLADRVCTALSIQAPWARSLVVAVVSLVVAGAAAGLAFGLADPVSDYGY